MFGLTNDERCSVHNLHVEKHWGLVKIMKMFSDKREHLSCA